ncbi:NifB/NifX family molybdenum-iron cluster-binding protein [Thermococcus kodakarensis]|nr:NifB/NifX family molybdenum-iron cluster-binding protein [Thermococcus kodakarensis]WCN29432.1 NifB/NifX family molybdenum-iron cluster-binding protein [Thermococcus kodakarensis]WCN31715.1 NifB/NifX family molybdenum-iron cluster-binding protein [Thermococcus kodakarensis]
MFLVNLGVNVLLTPMDCPKGKAILEAGGVKIIKVKSGENVKDVLNLLKD